MTELLTAAQMRAIEAAAIASGAVTGLELMERAGRGVVEAVWEEWPELKAGSFKAVVLCGPGNNGGDGFVVARLLKEWGWEVEVFLYGDAGKLPPDARVNYERWVGMGEVGALSEFSIVDQTDDTRPDLWIDALFGIGLSRPLAADVLQLLTSLNLGSTKLAKPKLAKVVAIDVPSGLDGDSGRWLQEDDRNPVDLTVTFHHAKVGHYVGNGAYYCRNVVVKDIGLPSKWRGTRALRWKSVVHETSSYSDIDVFHLSKDRYPNSPNKFSHGHALILSGGSGKGGAARMTARGALRVGAGLVTLGVPPAALQENAARVDAVMLREVEGVEALVEALKDERVNALCLGPGMGTGKREAGLLHAALEAARGLHPPYRSVVFDADALTILAGDPALFALLHDRCVLTPHGGEFSRLFPDIAARLEEPATKGPAYSKVDATREAAKRAGCIVLFKGPDTVIAAPDGRCSINSAHYDRAAPWLATAGSGDVLAGFITGLMARGFAPMQAAETAAWLHVECARSFGPGLIAEDLPEELPKVFRALGL